MELRKEGKPQTKAIKTEKMEKIEKSREVEKSKIEDKMRKPRGGKIVKTKKQREIKTREIKKQRAFLEEWLMGKQRNEEKTRVEKTGEIKKKIEEKGTEENREREKKLKEKSTVFYPVPREQERTLADINLQKRGAYRIPTETYRVPEEGKIGKDYKKRENEKIIETERMGKIERMARLFGETEDIRKEKIRREREKDGKRETREKNVSSRVREIEKREIETTSKNERKTVREKLITDERNERKGHGQLHRDGVGGGGGDKRVVKTYDKLRKLGVGGGSITKRERPRKVGQGRIERPGDNGGGGEGGVVQVGNVQFRKTGVGGGPVKVKEQGNIERDDHGQIERAGVGGGWGDEGVVDVTSKKLSTGNMKGTTNFKILMKPFEGGNYKHTDKVTFGGACKAKKLEGTRDVLGRKLSEYTEVSTAPSDGFGGHMVGESDGGVGGRVEHC